MRTLTLPLALLVAFSLSAACSDDDDGAGGGSTAGESSGGSDGDGGGSGGGGAIVGSGGADDPAVGGGGASGACEGTAETLVDGVDAFAVALAVSEESVAYVTRVDAGAPTDLAVVGLDGTGDGVIYSSPEGSAIGSMAWSGTDVVFLQAVDGEIDNTLFSVPAAGGDAVEVSTTLFKKGRLIGADADAAYIHNDNTPNVIVRVILATGDVETVGSVPAPGSVLQASLAGDELFFLAGSGLSTVYRLAVDAADAAPEAVFTGADNPACTFPLGGLVATPTKLVCGYTDVGAVSREDGASDGVIIDADPAHPAEHVVVASSDESIYMIEKTLGTRLGVLRRASSDGTDETSLVCDVGNIPTQTVDGFFPLANHYQIGVGGGYIVWAEEDQPDGPDSAVVTIRSAPL